MDSKMYVLQRLRLRPVNGFDDVRLRYRLRSVGVAKPEKGYFRCSKEWVCSLVEDGC